MTALAHAALHHAQSDDGQAAGGAGDHHVEVLELLGQVGQRHGGGAEALGQRAGALQRAVGDDHPPGVGGPMRGAQLDHLAGADEQHRAVGQVLEDLLAQAHAGSRHRDRLGADGGLGAHFLGHRERALEQLVQVAAQHVGILRHARGRLHLAQDLGFAQHHGIQPAGHAEGVAHGALVGQQVQVLGQVAFAVHAPVAADPFGQCLTGLVGGVGLAVDLGPVAGGQDGGFGGQRLQVATQIGQGRADRLLRGEGELLTQRHGRRVVVESERQQRHVECIYTSCMPCGRQISKHAPPVG